MILQQQNVVFDFGSTDQKRGKYHLPIGRLIAAENVQQDKTKSFKRRFADVSVGLSSKPADAIDMVNADFGIVARSSTDIRYADTGAANTWRTLGKSTAVGLECVDIVNADYGGYPTGCEVSGKFFSFSASAIPQYFFSIVDSQTRAEVFPVTVCSTGTVVGAGKAVASGSFAYLFYMSTNVTRIQVARISAAGVVTNFNLSLNGADNITNFDVTVGQNGLPLVSVWGATTNGVANSVSSYYVDTTSNIIQASPAPTTQALGAVPGTLGCWLSDKSLTYPRYYLATTVAAGTTTIFSVNATTLAFAAVGGTPLALASSANGVLVGYVLDDGTPSLVLFYTDGTVATVDIQTIKRYEYVTGTSTVGFIRNGYPIGEPFRPSTVGGSWYLVTGCSDPAQTQDAVYVYDVTANPPQIVARALYHRGGPDTNCRGNPAGAIPAHDPKSQSVVWSPGSAVVQFAVNGNVASTINGLVPGYATYGVRLDFAAAIGPMVTALSGRHVIIPGAWPQRVMGPLAKLVDIAPAMFPRTFSLSVVGAGGSLSPGVYSVRIMYLFASGDLQIRGPLSPVQTVTVTVNNSRLVLASPTLRKVNNNTPCFIKVYCSGPNGSSLFLVDYFNNFTNVDTIGSGITSVSAAEEPYTTGGVAERGSPPGCYSAFTWRDRTFLCGTEIPDEVWPSSDDPDIIGFDDLTAFRVLSGTGRVYAGAAVDDNNGALWKGDSAFQISGPGPNLLGAGTYSPFQLTGAPGCTNPHSIVTNDQGAYFQSADEGAMWIIPRALNPTYIGAGVKDLEGTAVQCAVHVPHRRQIRFYLNATTAIVWDYGNPLSEEGSLGQWYTWTTLSAVMEGACVRAGVAYIIQADGTLLKEDPTTYTTAFPLLQFPIVFAGIAGFACVYEGVLIGEFTGTGNIQIIYIVDGGAGQGGPAQQVWNKSFTAGPAALRFLPDAMDASSVIVSVSETSGPAVGVPRFSFDGIGFVVGIQPGLRRLNTSQNM